MCWKLEVLCLTEWNGVGDCKHLYVVEGGSVPHLVFDRSIKMPGVNFWVEEKRQDSQVSEGRLRDRCREGREIFAMLQREKRSLAIM